MRVAVYAPMKPPDHPVPSGDRRMARLVMDALRLAGHDVVLASQFRAYDGTGDPALQRAQAAQGRDEARRLIEAWRNGDAPDAWVTYHVYHKSPDWLGPAVACALGIPYLVFEPSHAPKRAGGAWDVGYNGAAKALSKADALVCLTRLDQALIAPMAKPGAAVEYLPPFMDAAPFAAAADRRMECRQVAAARWRLDPGAVWLLAVGMMRRGDKLDSYRALGEALRLMRGDDWQLLVVGDGAERPAVEAALRPRAIYTGEQPSEALPEIYAAADLCVWPAVGEAYGVALLEAQAAGLAVLACRTRGVPDVVHDGVTGVLVPPDDAVAFAAALRGLIDDTGRRAHLGAAAREHAAMRDLPAVARRLDALLHRLRR
jgi:glycosyltransferase involved in cell wall biosynthesis